MDPLKALLNERYGPAKAWPAPPRPARPTQFTCALGCGPVEDLFNHIRLIHPDRWEGLEPITVDTREGPAMTWQCRCGQRDVDLYEHIVTVHPELKATLLEAVANPIVDHTDAATRPPSA